MVGTALSAPLPTLRLLPVAAIQKRYIEYFDLNRRAA
jgi:hypothetical protein